MKISPQAEPFEFISDVNPDVQIILIHGFTASPTEVKPLGKYLFDKSSKKYFVRSILLPGHGVDGPDGFKALDTVSYHDWIEDCQSKIELFAHNYNCPVIIAGLSMGALLTINCLSTKFSEDPKFIAGILLSPALSIKIRVFSLIKYIKYFKKYQYKGKGSEEFFERYNLFSYHTRSLNASDEFRKLLNLTKGEIENIQKPVLSYLAEKDEMVNIAKALVLMNKNKLIETHKVANMEHIFTVYQESEKIFLEIYNWIRRLLEKTKTQ